jgi:hypothetical protein
MNATKRKRLRLRLQTKGWMVGDAIDFLNLSVEESAYVEHKLELFGKLSVAQAQKNADEKGHTLSHVVKKLRKKIRECGII